jgi:calcium-dependent protein kinase
MNFLKMTNTSISLQSKERRFNFRFCEGGELFDRLISEGNFTENKAASLMKQILSAIAFCHSKQVIHRDLKPENLLLDSKNCEDMRVKIIDFGIACEHDPQKQENLTQGIGTVIALLPLALLRST